MEKLYIYQTLNKYFGVIAAIEGVKKKEAGRNVFIIVYITLGSL